MLTTQKVWKFPTWITLRKLPVEFWSIGTVIVVRLGTVLRFDKTTIQVVEQQFCVALEVGDGWETSMVVKNEAKVKQWQCWLIMISYPLNVYFV